VWLGARCLKPPPLSPGALICPLYTGVVGSIIDIATQYYSKMRLQLPLPVLYITLRTYISSARVHILLKYNPLNAARECGVTFFSNIYCLYRACNLHLIIELFQTNKY
jgi:hypothetical protein